MTQLNEQFKTADWKSEKHVPVIDCEDTVPSGEMFQVQVTLGKEVDHPNTTEHHIRWIQLYFLPEGGKAPFELGKFEFSAHGESPQGANEGPVYTHHCAATMMKTNAGGTLMAAAYCNIHGLWESSKEIKVS
jgi:superoxide reductase